MKVKKYIFLISFFIALHNKAMYQLCDNNINIARGIRYCLGIMCAKEMIEGFMFFLRDYTQIVTPLNMSVRSVGIPDIHARCNAQLRNQIEMEFKRRLAIGIFCAVLFSLTYHVEKFCSD